VSNLVDIKDMSPNEALVNYLEELLRYAKSGELRSAIVVASWADNRVNHGWEIDSRTRRRSLLGEVAYTQYELMTQIGLVEGDSVLAKSLYE
jgi:hypothetical protein